MSGKPLLVLSGRAAELAEGLGVVAGVAEPDAYEDNGDGGGGNGGERMASWGGPKFEP